MMLRWCVAVALLTLVCAGASDTHSRFPDQGDPDEMISQLLHWIQGLSQQRNRKARQYFGGKPEKPRPFEPASYLPPVTGYPPAGSRPTPSYSEGPSPTYQPSSPFQPIQEQPSQPNYPSSFQPNQPTSPSYQPPQTSYQPPQTSYQPAQTPEQPAETPSQNYQPNPTYFPNQVTNQPSQPSQPNETDEPTQDGFIPNQTSPSQPNQPINPEGTAPTYETPQQTEGTQKPQENDNSPIQSPVEPDDDDRHPPHIHAISVDCGKEMMTINIEFNKPYNGIIYSQDHYKESECIYVRENSNEAKYSFTVSLNTCGTRFFSDFENEGQAYLENVLVLQNEPGIQEVWDHIRRVRCLWEGNLTKQLVSSLSVGMLNQVTSNFSGDTAMARLDIQTGRGPFAPEANGLIKIGEVMTLVVSVTGDAGFDIHVQECIARDADNNNVVPLTDSNGCVLKPKLFGAFQKTRETGNTGASIIAYAYFNAFKFPDEMDLIIQCEVELCKTDCEVCPNPGSTEPRRKRRDVIHMGNRTIEPVTTIGKGLRVVFAEDLPREPDFCVSPVAAIWGGFMVLLGSLMSSIIVSFCWQKAHSDVKLF
ncbi:uncharacterized protein LOC119837043 isoform X2 [Zerene cesonia]|uniref:uncharacterized protein LOC119837043 isoform X2 n=1 Tax=Zerene cesonia TaxID=33412 RepID=UPI0018E50A9C|nr:uncharacterized protein LOC119837043 isoform X2 [Zerene cesonia]